MTIIVSSKHLEATISKALHENFAKELIGVVVRRKNLIIGGQKIEIDSNHECENLFERKQIQSLLDILKMIEEQPITVNISDSSFIEINNILL